MDLSSETFLGAQLSGCTKNECKITSQHSGGYDTPREWSGTISLVTTIPAIIRPIAHPLLVHTLLIVTEERAIVGVAEPRVAVHLVRKVQTLVVAVAAVL